MDQPRIGEALAVHRVHEAIEPLKRMPLHITFVQAEGELVNITREMLRAGVMVDVVLRYRPEDKQKQPRKRKKAAKPEKTETKDKRESSM